jgi:tellurite resistance protein TerC
MPATSVGSPTLWLAFSAFILVMLVLDLGILSRGAKEVTTRAALAWTIVWISLALAFNVYIYVTFGPAKGLEFLTGYIIEKALSVDNLFVFLVLFGYFKVPASMQRRVLTWGIIGAVVMRAIFIFAGAALITRFHWIMYVFGAFLVFTGIKLLVQADDDELEPEKNPVIRIFRRFVRMVPDYGDGRFFVVRDGKRYATALLLVLVTVEATDVVFAVDSIPAIFAITTDPFIVYTSNIFAILGLRALYFLLAGMMAKFRYLNVGLGLILAFVGVKMLIADFYKVPVGLSLGVIALLLVGAIVASLLNPGAPSQDEEIAAPPVPPPGSEGDAARAQDAAKSPAEL